MRVLVAGAALKGTLDCRATTKALCAGVEAAGHTPVPVPIADGGDGSLVALSAAGFVRCDAPAHDAAGREVAAQFAWQESTRTAAVELAQAAGLWRVQGMARDPWRMTTYGFGELLRAAAVKGPRRLLALLGGSATQDAGAGMLQALDARLAPEPSGLADARWLERAEGIAADAARRHFADIDLRIVRDVNHVLAGPDGSARAFGPQKGFPAEALLRLDAAIGRFGHLLAADAGNEVDVPGSGAAGGTGAALLALGGRMVPGAQEILDEVGFFARLPDADVVITCEGQVDATTWRGKAPGLAMQSAAAKGLGAILVCAAEGHGARDGAARVVRAPGSPVTGSDLAQAAARALREYAAGGPPDPGS